MADLNALASANAATQDKNAKLTRESMLSASTVLAWVRP